MHPSSTRPLLLRGVLVASLLMIAGLASVATATATPLPTVSITLSPSSITVSGALQSGAVNIVSVAAGGREPSPGLLLLKPGVSPAEVYALLDANKVGEEPNLVSRYASIVFDGETPSPEKNTEVQTDLAPGQYVAVNAEGDKSAKWPRTSFTVTAAAAPAALPAPQATERSIDFAFRGPTTLHDGELVRFENEGYVVHMDIAFPTSSRANAQKAVKALLAGKEKAVEKLIAGEPFSFAGPLTTGAYQQETIIAKPGWYVQVCFMDTQDGRDHTVLGMERIIKITK
jgi:hypothetical protein